MDSCDMLALVEILTTYVILRIVSQYLGHNVLIALPYTPAKMPLGGTYISIVAPTNVWFLIALFVTMSPL